MIRAILFDCNGIIADDEPVHMRLFQQVLQEEGVSLSKEDYFRKYLAMDDRDCFKNALKDAGKAHGKTIVSDLIARKSRYYKEAVAQELRIFPGVSEFVAHHAPHCAMVVVSGALRGEIDHILKTAKIAEHFAAVVAAEDVAYGKPDPEGYEKGFEILSAMDQFKDKPLSKQECVAIEDSIHGVIAAQEAGIRCIAVTNSYTADKLQHADLVLTTLEGVDLNRTKF